MGRLRVKGRKLRVNERVRAREGVGLLVKEELERCVKERKEMKLTLGCERWVFIAEYVQVCSTEAWRSG